jgi:hypothetical protein
VPGFATQRDDQSEEETEASGHGPYVTHP